VTGASCPSTSIVVGSSVNRDEPEVKRKHHNEELISTKWRRWQEIRRQLEVGLEADLRRFYRAHPRADQSWLLAEDRRLLRLYTRLSPKLHGLRLWVTIATRLGRTSAAVQVRHAALRAGQRLARKRRAPSLD